MPRRHRLGMVESRSLKLYLGAFRNRARFSATFFSIERMSSGIFFPNFLR
jgi:NADPH-dependent 7-cyano-7-deazaguanine reductase QueF-like protein